MYRSLIIAIVAALTLLPIRTASATPTDGTSLLYCSPELELPQWQDIGMYDLLATCSETSLAPSPTSRTLTDLPSSWGHSLGALRPSFVGHTHSMPCPTSSHTPRLLYKLCQLRL